MICALCGKEVATDGPLGYVHLDTASRFGPDGHEVVPVRRPGDPHAP